MHVEPTYRHLRRERAWPAFELDRLEVTRDGTLRLARLPALDEALTEPIPFVAGLEGPAGVGIAPNGDLYLSDPAAHRILRVDACDGSVTPLPCLRGPGSRAGELRGPRGLIVGPRGAVYIADSGNARVLVVDLATQQVVGVWGGASPDDRPGEARPPGRFHQPWDLAADRHGRIYVADPGEAATTGWRFGRVQRFRPGGQVDADFAAVLAAQDPAPGAPAGIVMVRFAGEDPAAERLLVLDLEPPRLLVHRLDGRVDREATARWAQVAGRAGEPAAVEFGADRLYVAGTGGRVLVFDAEGRFLGHAEGADAGAAGLGLDCAGRLVAHPGAGGRVLRAGADPAFAPCGTFLAGPFEAQALPALWQRIRLEVDALPHGAHFRLFTRTSDVIDGPGGPPVPPDCDAVPPAAALPAALAGASATRPEPHDLWHAAPWDAPDLFVHNQPGRYVWIAGILQGDGRASPVVRQIRLDHDRDGWIALMPALYRRDEPSRAFLMRALTLFETVHEDVEHLIDELPRRFDAWAAPDADGPPTWLDWLAGWLDAPLGEEWEEAARRRLVARAFQRHGARGTPAAIRELIRLYTGVDARITDGAALAGAWALGSMRLGSDTRLGGAEAQGTVFGTSATVDRSHLNPAEEFGAPLFDDFAHCFEVEIYAADLRGSDALDRVRWVIEREKPAHTVYLLCVIEPRMRVGLQARVGIDTLVAGPPRPLPWGGGRRLGADTVLPGGEPDEVVDTKIGEPARLGFKLR